MERAVFAADGSGIVGYSKVEQPLVRDDESGIVYCTPFLVPWVDGREVTLVPPGGGFRHRDAATARVLACVVGSRGADEADSIRTRLVVEMLAAPAAYR